MSINYQIEIYITIVALEDLSLRLDSADNLLQVLQLLRLYICDLIEKDDVTEFHLLDYERSEILLIKIWLHQVRTIGKLILHTKCIHDCYDAVKTQDAVLDILRAQGWDRADGLCNRCRLADTACLYYNIVETLHIYNLLELFYEVHLQGTANTSILERNQGIILLAYHATFLYESCINIHLTNIIDDNGKLDTLLVSQNLVEQGSLTTAQIACQKQDWNFFIVHKSLFL